VNAVNRLLDKYRETCSLPSDMALATSLGIKRQSVHAWRHGTAWPSDEHIHAMASAIGEESMSWLIPIHAERASGPVKKDWLQLAKSLGYAAASITAVIGLAVYTPESKASGVVNNNGTGYTLCASLVLFQVLRTTPTCLANDQSLS